MTRDAAISCGIDVLRAELHAGAEIGLHGALRIGGHEDETARGGRPGCRGRCGEMHAEALDVVAEDPAELVALAPCR